MSEDLKKELSYGIPKERQNLTKLEKWKEYYFLDALLEKEEKISDDDNEPNISLEIKRVYGI